MSRHSHTVDPNFQTKFNPDNDPCYFEGQYVLDCRNSSESSDAQCKILAKNLKQCRQFWKEIKHDRKRRGIKPLLPCVIDRPEVMAEHHQKLEQIKERKGCVVM